MSHLTLIEASAGTGKTFRIAQMVLEQVADVGHPIQSIVVVTFTHAATAELKSRLRERLRDALAGLRARGHGQPYTAPDEVLDGWLKQASALVAMDRLRQALVDFDEAPISTLHGFCSRVLTRYAFESGVRFDSEMVGEIEDLRREIVRDYWASLTYDLSPEVLAILETGGLNKKNWPQLMRHRARGVEVMFQADPSPPPDGSEWTQVVATARQAWDVDGICAALDGSTYNSKKGSRPGFPGTGTRTSAEGVARWLARVTLLSKPVKAVAFFALDRVAAAAIGEVPTHPGLDALDRLMAVQDRLGQAVQAFIDGVPKDFLSWAEVEVERRMKRRDQRTFHDLLKDLAQALEGPHRAGLLEGMRRDCQVAFIDEFQDTDAVQWAIFHTAFADRLTVIGDPKQSIYGFRGGDPHIYEQASRLAVRAAPLDRNFRSDKPLVEAVNQLFGHSRQPFAKDELDYFPVKAKYPVRLLGSTRAPLHFRFFHKAYKNPYYAGHARRFCTRWVASDIADTLVSGLTIEGQPVLARDCAVLTRTNPEAAQMQEELALWGIPSTVKAQGSVMKSMMATALLTVLEAVNDPLNGGLVRRALITPILGFSIDTLGQMDADPRQFEVHAGRVRAWAQTVGDKGFYQAFQQIIDERGVVARLLGDPNGARWVTDLLHLGDLLHSAWLRLSLDLDGLLHWLRRGGPDLLEDDKQQRVETDANAVQIITVHSSKGLEFPLVWCPYSWNGGELWGDDKEMPRFHDPVSGRECVDTGGQLMRVSRAKATRENRQEELRKLYVALTRAKHQCVVLWGRAGTKTPPLGWLLHRPDLPSDLDDEAIDDLFVDIGDLDDDVYRADLDRWATHEGISWDEIDPFNPPDPVRVPMVTSKDLPQVRALTRTKRLDTWWRRSSFSSLKGAGVRPSGGHEAAVRDTDEDTEAGDEVKPVATVSTDLVPMHPIRGGTDVGTFLHDVFEHHDFSKPAELPNQVLNAMVGRGLDLDGDVISRALQDVIDTPLPMGLSLSTLPRSRRLDELAFTLGVRGGHTGDGSVFSVKDLAAAYVDVPEYAERLRHLQFLPLRGYLHGFIDLVFEHDGKFYVVDYKSNWLGNGWGDYGPDSLDEEMQHRHYLLQANLYAVATCRMLKSRLRDYDFDKHFGGCMYLFLRGMAPDRPGLGVWFERTPQSRIAALDAALRGDP